MYDLVAYRYPYRNYQWSTTAAGLFAHTAHDLLTAAPHSPVATEEEDTNQMYGVTNDRDAVLQYRRKRMPWGKKRKWVKFVKMVEAVERKNEGTKTAIRNSTITASWNDTTQFMAAATLYGLRGTDTSFSVGNNDVSTIFSADSGTDSPFEFGRFTSAVMDVTLTNSGTNRLEIDVYEILFYGQQAGINLLQDLTTGLTGIGLPGAGYAALSTSTRGLTPFDVTAFCARGYRIIKKTKYFIAPNNIMTYQIRDPKDRKLDGSVLYGVGAASNGQWKGVTRNLLFVGKAVPGSTFTAVPPPNANIFNIGVTRTYKYKLDGDTTDEAGSI